MILRTARVSLVILASLFFLGLAVSSSPLAPTTRDFSTDLAGRFPRILKLDLVMRDRASSATLNKVHEPSLELSPVATTESFELFSRETTELLKNQLPASLPFRSAIQASAIRHRLDSRLLAAVVEAESNFDPQAVSRRGAVGLTQILPQTDGRGSAELQDPEINLDAGARYLRLLLDQYGGETHLALAAYNAGPGRVNRYRGVPPFAETERYVERVSELYQRHQQGAWPATTAMSP